MYVFIDFFVDYHRLSGSCMVNNWSSSCSTRDSSPPPSCWSWSSWIFFFLQSSTIWTHSIMRWQATDHYYRECAILQLQIFGIWKSSPATPKTGVWLKPVLAVGNWSRPIISQSARERERKKEWSVDQAKEQGWEWAHILQKVFFFFCIDHFIRWGTLSQYIF